MAGNYTKGEANELINQLQSLVLSKREEIIENKPSKISLRKPHEERLRNIEPLIIKQEETIEVIDSEVIGETEPQYTRTRHRWTDTEELDVLCDFYELSSDEARERFQRPYYAIAKRLELIVDSTEPKYIAMLMEASEVVSQRKREEDMIKNMGYWKRRKLRKQAKKLAKLERKLSKLRGE